MLFPECICFAWHLQLPNFVTDESHFERDLSVNKMLEMDWAVTSHIRVRIIHMWQSMHCWSSVRSFSQIYALLAVRSLVQSKTLCSKSSYGVLMTLSCRCGEWTKTMHFLYRSQNVHRPISQRRNFWWRRKSSSPSRMPEKRRTEQAEFPNPSRHQQQRRRFIRNPITNRSTTMRER